MFLLDIIAIKKKVGIVGLFVVFSVDTTGLSCEFGKELRNQKIGNKDL